MHRALRILHRAGAAAPGCAVPVACPPAPEPRSLHSTATAIRITLAREIIACNQELSTPNSSTGGITIYDIAESVKVSPSTVSRVLNNSRLVHSSTRERVLKAADEMGYRKRRIRRQHARTILNIALLLPFGGNNYLHLFYDAAEFIHALNSGFGDVRANIVTMVNESGVQLFDHKTLGNIDACVFGFTSPTAQLLQAIDARGIPVVLINRIDAQHNYVVSDHAAGMERLLTHLLSINPHAHPCYLGFPVIPQVSELRREGLLKAAVAHGIPVSESDTFDLESLCEITPQLIERLLNRGYDTFMCFNDVVAVYAYQCALGMGLRIPDEFSLTGFDNSPVRSLVCDPIATIDLTVAELGYLAGRWLRDTIIDKSESALQLHVPGDLIPGVTVGRPQREPRKDRT